MTDGGCLVIDDVDAALSTMSALGRSIVADPSYAVRDAALAFARQRRWTIVPYDAYRAWAETVIEESGHRWLVLDPLFTWRAGDAQTLPFRVSRVGSGTQFESHCDCAAIAGGEGVSILDDAASSGGTLLHVSRMVQARGASIYGIAVCGSTRVARDLVQQYSPCPWRDYVVGDWRIMHARDGCPFLPFTGRRVDHAPVIAANGNAIALRAPATAVVGSVWQTLYLVTPVRNAILRASAAATDALSRFLGRAAEVQDITLLGAAVPALVPPGARATERTLLSELMPM